LSLLAATCHIDLRQESTARARLRTATALAKQIERPDIEVWCLETEAWARLTNGDYSTALKLSRGAQELAPRNSSILIQATAQEGRVLARLRDRQTYDVLNRLQRLTEPLASPATPEHHFVYDPQKAVSYLATTLAWLGDPAAEEPARIVIANAPPGKRPRRIALARIDLASCLITHGRTDEAVAEARKAILSGYVAPSSEWRVTEAIMTAEEKASRRRRTCERPIWKRPIWK